MFFDLIPFTRCLTLLVILIGKLSSFTSWLNWLLFLSHVSLMYMLKIIIKSTILGEISQVMHGQCIEEDLGHKEHRV